MLSCCACLHLAHRPSICWAIATPIRSKTAGPRVTPARVSGFVANLFLSELHLKRIASLADATTGVLHWASLAIHAIGRGLAVAKGRQVKHAVKQVDRLLSNANIDVWALFASWVPFVLGQRTEAVVAMDWTDFDADDHTTLAIHLITSHGRATPLLWLTVRKSTLKDQRNAIEDKLLHRLREVVPQTVLITVLADRGFGDQKLYEYLKELGFDYIIRFREAIVVTDDKDVSKPASQWVPQNFKPRILRGARVTQALYPVEAVVCIKDVGMKDSWCLATSRKDLSAWQVVRLYGKRFTIEESFRDGKDIRFGLGLSQTHISEEGRRDRLLLVCAMAVTLLTLLGAAGESMGLDRMLKVNTVKYRTHSLFNQGTYYYQALETWSEERCIQLLIRFGELLAQQPWCRAVFGTI